MKKIYLFVISILGSVFIYIKGEKNGKQKESSKQTKKILKKVNTKNKIKTRVVTSSNSAKLRTRD